MSEVPKKLDSESSDTISIGRIALKQVRVKRNETPPPAAAASSANPMNRLVPYLDLFSRLNDDELARLSAVDPEVVAALRQQVVTIDRGLAAYVDLLPRLGDDELVRLTGAAVKTIRFWRLCQPRQQRVPEQPQAPEPDAVVARAAASKATTAPMPAAPAAAEGASHVAGEDGGSAADSQPMGQVAEMREFGDTGPHPIPRTDSEVSRYMTFSGAPFPGYDESGEKMTTEPPEEEEEDPLAGFDRD